MNKQDFLERDLYSIEQVEGAPKDMHILHTFTDDMERAPYVRTDFTFCIVPLADFIRDVQADKREGDYKTRIIELQAEVKQYEYEFNTLDEMVADTIAFLNEGEPQLLDYDEITEDTPCGIYLTKSKMSVR